MVNLGGKPKRYLAFGGILLSALILLGGTTGCTSGMQDIGPLPAEDFLPDIYFREFYEILGGERVLGRPISPLITKNNVFYQYLESCLLSWDPSAPDTMFFKLIPLGIDLGYQEPPTSPPTAPDLKYINGHIIFPEFVPFYETMVGDRFFGKPISDVRYNPQRKRYEQYFENVGLYRKQGDPPGSVRLLAYGTAYCGQECNSPINDDSAMDILPKQESPFRDSLSRFPHVVTGFPLTAAYLAPNGKLEQIFENVALTADPENFAGATLYPLPGSVGILPGSLEAPNGDPGYFFYAVEGELGYNIPNDFWSYLQSLGGVDISGPPITSMPHEPGQRLRQCFLNLCLVRDLNFPEGQQIRVDPQGYLYKELYWKNNAQGTDTNGAANQQIVLNVWELYPALETGQVQEIVTSVLQGGTPLASVEASLEITLPNGQQQQYLFPPTDAAGESRLQLPLIEARSYTLVPYRVCIQGANVERSCKEDTFIILNQP